MRKKVTKPLVKVDKRIHVVHLNVGSGYVTYLEEDLDNGFTVVKGIPLDRPISKKRAAKS